MNARAPLAATVKAEDTATKMEESMSEEASGAGMDAAAVLAEAEAAEKFLDEVDESKVILIHHGKSRVCVGDVV